MKVDLRYKGLEEQPALPAQREVSVGGYVEGWEWPPRRTLTGVELKKALAADSPGFDQQRV